MRNIQALHVLTALISFHMQLRLFGFQRLFKTYIQKYEIREERTSITEDEIQQIEDWMALIDRTCTSVPFDAQCMHRSFLAYRFVRSRFRVPVNLVIGVRKFPFYAHAWLMLRGKNFNEPPDFTDTLSIILDSGKVEETS
ncbi:transglutaminase superfamily protein [Paenibacillus cellulosilyticus]|uniref:Transglutaminase superfamily protein n=1 Tax=Paenibacillus cellulosilyticus TaxID=375489 RepID=A0A2V2YRI6_9BACL|nr:lasso peptide biosynthesis B2 protein [Paenibacillus cellulosilyticus]PWV95959.1 transglutaminase superfamily protein [Paenibacillus cellulosilyticus]QKS48428.1 lasso peptide biosynthesis B2 protein [Paenibacillus cellulosilyticus]